MMRMAVWAGTLLAAVASTARAQGIPDFRTVRGELAFDGHGTPGDFTGRTSSVRGQLVGASSIDGVRGWVEADAGTLVTGNARRDRDMRKSLEVDRFPTLRFDLDGATAGAVVGDSTAVELRGRFTIHGVTQPTVIRGWARVTPRDATFRGQVPLLLTDYRIGGLSKALGLLTMRKQIVIKINLTFAN